MIQPALMQEANGNFLPNQDEVTMTVRTDSFKINNYNDVVDEKTKDVQTELSMQPGEFEKYEISKVGFLYQYCLSCSCYHICLGFFCNLLSQRIPKSLDIC